MRPCSSTCCPTWRRRPTGHAVTELRTRVFAETALRPRRARLRLTAAGFAEGLVADRRAAHADARRDRPAAGTARRGALVEGRPARRLQPRRLGASRRVPADRRRQSAGPDAVLSRGTLRRAHAGRHGSRRAGCRPTASPSKAIYVPFFRRGRFDQLDEDTSPFNLAAGGFRAVAHAATAHACGERPGRRSRQRHDGPSRLVGQRVPRLRAAAGLRRCDAAERRAHRSTSDFRASR